MGTGWCSGRGGVSRGTWRRRNEWPEKRKIGFDWGHESGLEERENGGHLLRRRRRGSWRCCGMRERSGEDGRRSRRRGL